MPDWAWFLVALVAVVLGMVLGVWLWARTWDRGGW
jgi:hypothetical protein